IQTLKDLRDLGNSVIVVEHDEDMIRSADYVVDMGPGAGEHGGEIVAQGTPDEITHSGSLTGQYLSGARTITVPEHRPVASDTPRLFLKGCRGNNLKDVNLAIPAGRLVCISGVSGSDRKSVV